MKNFEELNEKLNKQIKEMEKKDSALNNAVFWEFVYSEISDLVNNDLKKIYILNRYMIDIGLGGVRVIRDKSKINMEGDYYTITGAQHIISVKVPELVVDGRVFKKSIDFDKEGGVNFVDRVNIFEKFCKSESLTEKNANEFRAWLKDIFKIKEVVEQIMDKDALEKADNWILRHNIIFQAKWNGVEKVRELLK